MVFKTIALNHSATSPTNQLRCGICILTRRLDAVNTPGLEMGDDLSYTAGGEA